jgi:hypothetical protein
MQLIIMRAKIEKVSLSPKHKGAVVLVKGIGL